MVVEFLLFKNRKNIQWKYTLVFHIRVCIVTMICRYFECGLIFTEQYIVNLKSWNLVDYLLMLNCKKKSKSRTIAFSKFRPKEFQIDNFCWILKLLHSMFWKLEKPMTFFLIPGATELPGVFFQLFFSICRTGIFF